MKLIYRKQKHLIGAFLIAAVIVLTFVGCSGQNITMDNQLKELITERLEITGRDLKKSDLLLLTELQIKDIEIQTLNGLRDCINLEKLVLQNCNLSDISELKNLTSLKYLNIALNPKIKDITPISKLRDLEVLIASGIIVDDISSLEKNTNLKRLYLNNTKNIKDIKPLAKLDELSVLEFYDNQISDLEPLSELVNLERLWCNQNNISDISPIQFLVKLKYLIISNNSISDLEPLAGLHNLAVLDFSNNNVSNISVISDLIKHEAFTDTTYNIWWMEDINNSPFINMKGNLINHANSKERTKIIELTEKKGIALIHN